MKIIISSTGRRWNDLIDSKFENAKGYILINEETNKKSWHANEVNMDEVKDIGIQAAEFVVNSGASVLITGSVGSEALNILNQSKIKIYNAAHLSVKDGWIDYTRGLLYELLR